MQRLQLKDTCFIVMSRINITHKVKTSMESKSLPIKELKDAFFSLKTNKSPGHDGVSLNVTKKYFSSYVNL